VVVHDVADRTLPLCRRLVDEIHAVAPVPLTLLAVPRYHGEAPTPALEDWLDARAADGHELALHGYSHRDDRPARGLRDYFVRRIYTRGEGEFLDLGIGEARWRLHRGMRWFERRGWPLDGFVAPAWLLGRPAWQALRTLPGLRYTATLRHVHALAAGRHLTAQSLVYSTDSAWRRTASRAWVAVQSRLQADRPLLRLELHPRDVCDRAIRRSWQSVLERAVARRSAMTMASFVTRLGNG
jgi:predicted deacetylase